MNLQLTPEIIRAIESRNCSNEFVGTLVRKIYAEQKDCCDEVNLFLDLARYSDGWNSYTFEQFKEFLKREKVLAAKG